LLDACRRKATALLFFNRVTGSSPRPQGDPEGEGAVERSLAGRAQRLYWLDGLSQRTGSTSPPHRESLRHACGRKATPVMYAAKSSTERNQMMSNATKRTILRWIHLVLAIPILGYIYSPFAELPNYAAVTRFVFAPVMILAGYWMYAGAVFAVIGVAVWLGAYRLSGIGTAILSQVVLFFARKIWSVIRARRSKRPS